MTYQRDCRSQVCSIYQTLSAPFFPGCLWMLLVKQPVTNAICPAWESSPTPSFITAALLCIHAILTPHLCAAESRGLFQTIPWDPRKSCDPLWSENQKCHPWLFLMNLHVLSISLPTSLFLFKLLSASVYHAFDVQIFLLQNLQNDSSVFVPFFHQYISHTFLPINRSLSSLS